MFSAFKRFTAKGDGQTVCVSALPPPGHHAMSTSLQRKFSKGVQYNMKIVIKGDRNVGKTCLFHRLQGKQFIEEYLPTEEIQVASIQWSYKATDDVVKVEVWDVVDRGKKKKRLEGLKLDNRQVELPEETALDAEFLDVYKGTHGVIIMMDLTKSWTFDYIQRELIKIPVHLPIVVLANHCDMAHHRTVTNDQVLFFIESISESRGAQVRYSESSMRNGFGLKFLHKFFNLPFLQLQKESLQHQLERNTLEIESTVHELNAYCESDEANYTKYVEKLSKKRREIANNNTPIEGKQQSQVHSSLSTNQLNNSNGIIESLDQMKRSQSGPIVIGAGQPIPYSSAPHIKSSGKMLTKNSGHKPSDTLLSKNLNKLTVSNPMISIDDFCPDGGQIDRSFLDDVPVTGASQQNDTCDSDTDNDMTANPLVSEFQDDFDGDDFISLAKPVKAPKADQRNFSQRNAQSEGNVVAGGCCVNFVPEDGDTRLAPDEFDATLNSEISELASDPFDAWISTDTKWRRSPDGGEDVSSIVSQTLDFSTSNNAFDDSTSVTSSNVHMELLSSSKHSASSINGSLTSDEGGRTSAAKSDQIKTKKDKKERKEKRTKKKDKQRDTVIGDRGSKRQTVDDTFSHRDELEEFLNGDGTSPIDVSAYEAL